MREERIEESFDRLSLSGGDREIVSSPLEEIVLSA